MSKIRGGYYIRARCIQESEIQHAPPHVREIWDWFLMKANHAPYKRHGYDFDRGQLLCTYSDIQEALHWTIGWRKKSYSKGDCETAMKWLKKRVMVTTKKTTKGMIVTICNYDYFQDPKNYETDKGTGKKPTVNLQSDDTIYKKKKKKKNEKNTESDPPKDFKASDCLIEFCKEKGISPSQLKYYEESCFDYFRSKGTRRKDWEATLRNWIRKDRKLNPKEPEYKLLN